jgi:hypothetical protein
MATVDLRSGGEVLFRGSAPSPCVTMNSRQLESMCTIDVPAAIHDGCISNRLPQRIQVEADMAAISSSWSGKHGYVDDHAAIRYLRIPGDGVPLVY